MKSYCPCYTQVLGRCSQADTLFIMHSNLGQLQPHHTPLPDRNTVGFMGDSAGREDPANPHQRVPKQVSFDGVTEVIGVVGAGPDLPANPPSKQVSFGDVAVIGVAGSGPELPGRSPSERINTHAAQTRLDRAANSQSAPVDDNDNDENTLSTPAPPKSKKVSSAVSVDVHHETNKTTDKVRVERSVLRLLALFLIDLGTSVPTRSVSSFASL